MGEAGARQNTAPPPTVGALVQAGAEVSGLQGRIPAGWAFKRRWAPNWLSWSTDLLHRPGTHDLDPVYPGRSHSSVYPSVTEQSMQLAQVP